MLAQRDLGGDGLRVDDLEGDELVGHDLGRVLARRQGPRGARRAVLREVGPVLVGPGARGEHGEDARAGGRGQGGDRGADDTVGLDVVGWRYPPCGS